MKRSASSSSSSSSSSDESDVSAESGVSNVIDAECALVGDYIDNDLVVEPLFPEDFLDLIFGPSSFYVSVLTERVPTFLALLTSTPTLYGDLSQDIADAAAQLPMDVGFDTLAALFADFIAVADDECDIELNQEQTTQIDRFFDDALTLFQVITRDCSFLSASIVEDAVAAAEFSATDPTNLAQQLQVAAGGNLLFTPNRTAFNIEQVLELPPGTPVDDIEEAADTAFSELLFYVNDFCGFPMLSGATLETLGGYYLVSLVELAGGV